MSINVTELIGGSVVGAGLWDQIDRYDDISSQIGEGYSALTDSLVSGSEFTPFSVSGYGGGANVGADGSVNVNLDAAQQAQAQSLTGYADNLFASAAGDQSQRIQDSYDAIRATQMPEEERAYHELEGRLQAQGRAGLASDLYGSSPEMLSYNKAVAEARNSASLAAIGEARAQQMQDATIGTQFQSNAYLPQAQMLNLLNSGFQGAGLNQAGQLAGMNIAAQLGSESVRSQINAEQIRAGLLNNLFQTAGGVISSQSNGGSADPFGDLLFGDSGLFSWL